MSELKALSAPAYNKAWSAPIRFSCYACSDTGALLAASNQHDSALYAFRCFCTRGQYNKRSYPQWTHEIAKSFTLPKDSR